MYVCVAYLPTPISLLTLPFLPLYVYMYATHSLSVSTAPPQVEVTKIQPGTSVSLGGTFNINFDVNGDGTLDTSTSISSKATAETVQVGR